MPITLLVLAAFALFACKRTLTYLHIYQQDEYDSSRFVPWLLRSFAVDRRVTLSILVAGLLALVPAVPIDLPPVLAAAVLVAAFVFEANPRRAAKKPLALTNRARRIAGLAIGLSLLAGAVVALPRLPLLVWIVPVQLIPLTLALANWMLTPVERSIQQAFWQKAHDKLKALHPTVIGITGSYGKTSVKHILGHILETQAPTLMTPGSVNTPMGISRIVLEQLNARHKYFLCEMGAYGIGSIARLCRLAPPDVGVIISIGLAHHERFKTLDAVARTKLELAQAALARNGSVVISTAYLAYAYSETFIREHRASCTLVGADAESEYRIVSSGVSKRGVEAVVEWQGRTYELAAPLFGEHHAFNMVIAFATACRMGVAPEDVRTALASTPQIKHRLEVRREANGATVIDDAYNANPTGFASGLALLTLLQEEGGRRVVVTPGMVELGDAHDEEHAKIGRLAADAVDLFLAIKPERIPTMIEAFSKNSASGTLLTFATFAEAQAWLRANLRGNDVVLLENDLPDLYERRLKL